ncbi:unnamed protein product [Linum tenue]|uniref:Uncharacterized protein n=1 Tax=Linum tenue TaxID=586396 RepID=A0AAV0HE38_9ROSI|nr:unnamed protein product [Linum tenue]
MAMWLAPECSMTGSPEGLVGTDSFATPANQIWKQLWKL